MPDEKLTPEQFGQKIKAKYPQYKDMPDLELADKMLAKFPEYQDMVITDVKKKEPTKMVPAMGSSLENGSLGSGNLPKTALPPLTLPKDNSSDATRREISLDYKQEPKQQTILPPNTTGDNTLVQKPFKDTTPTRETQADFDKSISTVTPDLIDREEEFVVPELNNQFKDHGFKFEETGKGDEMVVTAPNGKTTTIDLDPVFTSTEVAQSKKLQDFIKANKREPSKLEKSIFNQEAYNKRFLDEKEIDETRNKLNQGQNSFDADIKQLSILPKGSPEYEAKAKELEARYNKLDSDKKSLERSVGRYTFMQSQQGTFTGGIWNSILEGAGSIASGLLGAAIDASSVGSVPIPDIAKKMMKQEYLPPVREGLVNTFGDKNTTEQWKELGFVRSAIMGLAESAPAMAGGVTAMPALMYAQVSDNVDKQMMDNPDFADVSEDEKMLVKVPLGIVSAALETYGFRNVIKQKGLLNNIALKAIGQSGEGVTSKTFKELVDNEIQGELAKGLLRIGAGGLAEFETGAAQEVADISIKQIYNAAKEKKMFNTPSSVGEYLGDVFKAGLQEAVGGFILSTPNAIGTAYQSNSFKKVDNATMEVFTQVANDPKVLESMDIDLKMKVNSGELTPEQAQEQNTNYREAVGVLNSIDTEGLEPEEIKEKLVLGKEVKDLELKKEGKIPSDRKIIQAKIDALNEKLFQIGTTKAQQEDLTKNKDEKTKTKTETKPKAETGKTDVLEAKPEPTVSESAVGEGIEPSINKTENEITNKQTGQRTEIVGESPSKAVTSKSSSKSVNPKVDTKGKVEQAEPTVEKPSIAEIKSEVIAKVPEAEISAKKEGVSMKVQKDDLLKQIDSAREAAKEHLDKRISGDELIGSLKEKGFEVTKNPNGVVQVVFDVEGDGTFKLDVEGLDIAYKEVEKHWNSKTTTPKTPLKLPKQQAIGNYSTLADAEQSKQDALDNLETAKKSGNKAQLELYQKQAELESEKYKEAQYNHKNLKEKVKDLESKLKKGEIYSVYEVQNIIELPTLKDKVRAYEGEEVKNEQPNYSLIKDTLETLLKAREETLTQIKAPHLKKDGTIKSSINDGARRSIQNAENSVNQIEELLETVNSELEKSNLSPKELAKQKIADAHAALKKKVSGGLSSGGLYALPEFIDLVVAYVESGIVTAKEFLKILKEDFPDLEIDEAEATKVFDKANTPKKEKGPREVKKTITTKRAYEGDIREGVKKELEKIGLTRPIESQLVAKAKAKEFIDSVGEEAALDAVRNNDVPDAAGAYVWDELIQRSEKRLILEKDPTEIARLEKFQAELLDEFSAKATSAGRFNSALNDIYKSSEALAYNVDTKIKEYKEANGGEISPEVEAKFRDLDKQYQEVKVKLVEAEERAKKLEEEIAFRDLKEAEQRAKKQAASSKIRKDTDWIVTKIKEAKIHRPGMFSAATPASLVWDGAVETVATAIKATGRSAEAIAKGIEYVKASDWFKSLSSKDKGIAEKQFVNFWNGRTSPRIVDGKIKIPDGLIRELVEAGADSIEQLVKEVKEIMEFDYPDISERDIRDAITEYGKVKSLNKEEISTEIRKMKRIGRILSGLEDVNKKMRPLRSGLQRDKLDAQERALAKELREAMKELPLDEGMEAEQQKTATDAAKTRIQNQIEDLQREIDKGERVPRSVRTVKDDAELIALKAERDALKVKHEAMFKDEEFKQAKRLEASKKANQKRIEDLQRRIKEGDFSKKVRTPLIVDSELIKLRAEKLRIQEEYDKELYKAKLKNRTKTEKVVDSLWEIWAIPRLLMATGEMSFVLIQGLKLSIAHPIHAAKSFKNALMAFSSEKKTEQFLSEIKAQEWYPILKESNLALTKYNAELEAREELFYSGWTNIIWDTLGKAVVSPLRFKSKESYDKATDIWSKLNPFKAFERAAVGYLDTLRVLRFLDGLEVLKAKEKNFHDNPKDFKDVANAINTMTGRASLGKAELFAPTLSKVFFSPRNWASGIKTATPYALWHFGKMTPTARKMAIADFSKFVGITTSMVMLAAAYLNSDDDEETAVELDPRSSDFMKIKLGDKRVDPWGGMQQQVVLSSRLMAWSLSLANPDIGAYKKGDEVLPLGVKHKTPTALDLLGRQAINKLNPTASILYNFLAATRDSEGNLEDQYGNEVSVKKQLQDKFNPIFWGTVGDLLKDDPTALDGLLTFYAFFGGGVSTQQTKPKSSTFHFNQPKRSKSSSDNPSDEFDKIRKQMRKELNSMK